MRMVEILVTHREGEGLWEDVAKVLNHATVFIRKCLAERLCSRYVPELYFLHDYFFGGCILWWSPGNVFADSLKRAAAFLWPATITPTATP
ncbi:hypothetical protein DSUL_60317 [Desulfovibrionales bacterium]